MPFYTYVKLRSIKEELSVIGLAETNVDPCNKDLYKLKGYSSCYQSKKEGKDKGSGVALYIHEKYNFTELSSVSCRSDNLESIFVEITNTLTPINVGVIYRPPNGDITQFMAELIEIMTNLPDKKTFILGDFNIDLLDGNDNKIVQNFEDIVISSGFTPLISIHTHHRPNCRKTCIDNILTNTPENVLASGTVDNGSNHHKPVFQFSFLNMRNPEEDKVATKIYYDYNNSNVEKFCSHLRQNSESLLSHQSFSSFLEFYESNMKNLQKSQRGPVSQTHG